ncbi:MAG: hypothetical protein IPK82_36670 [Polyangiaceae bacterium]|nr:hypothetical protein [Polyangiaceae bacterium]
MDGKRIRDFWAAEAEAVLATYRHFETLLPNGPTRGASHAPEDGRYVEALLRQFLQRFLPRSLEVFSGFVLRPAVKTAMHGRERRHDQDAHSGQLDIIVHDSATYPVYERFSDAAIVPPEGVLAVISVKKSLRPRDIAHEALALSQTSLLCQCEGPDRRPLRGPFLALVGMTSMIMKRRITPQRWIFDTLRATYEADPARTFEETVGYIGAIDEWSIIKSRPSPQDAPRTARYFYMAHRESERHLTLQHLLTGILGVFYDPSRRAVRRPGFTAFESQRQLDGVLGKIKVAGMRRALAPAPKRRRKSATS